MSFVVDDQVLYSIDYGKLIEEFKDGVELKNRKYHLKTYKNCFIGSEAVSWLVERQWAASREEAVILGCFLQKKGIFHHVAKAHAFGDKFLFFKYTKQRTADELETQFLLDYRFEEVVQIVKHVSWMATIRKVNSVNKISLLQLFEGLYCDGSDIRTIEHLYNTLKSKPHSNLVPIEHFVASKTHLLVVSPTPKGLCLLPGLYRYHKMHPSDPHSLLKAIQQITKQIVSALVHLHSLGIAYGRLIPSNILFTKDNGNCTTIQLTGIAYAIAAQYYKGIYIKDSNLLAPESNPLSNKGIKFFGNRAFQNSNATSQEILFGIDPYKFLPADDSWSVGILLYIMIYGENPYPSWDIRDRYDLIQNGIAPSRIAKNSDDMHLGTPNARDLISKLLSPDNNNRMKLVEALKHPFFTDDSNSFDMLGFDWELRSDVLLQRYNRLWPSFHRQTITKNTPPASSIFSAFPMLTHLSLPFQSFNTDGNKYVHRIVVFGSHAAHVDNFLSRCAAEINATGSISNRTRRHSTLLDEFSKGGSVITSTSLSDSISRLEGHYETKILPTECFYINGSSTLHFVRGEDQSSNFLSIDITPIHYSLTHADSGLFVCFNDKKLSLDDIIQDIISHFCPRVSDYSPISSLNLQVLVIGYNKQESSEIASRVSTVLPQASLTFVNFDCNTVIPKIVKIAKEQSLVATNTQNKEAEKELACIRTTPNSLQIIGKRTKLDEKTFKTITTLLHSVERWKILDFRNCSFKSSQWSDLMNSIYPILKAKLMHLQFSGCPIGDEATVSLLYVIARAGKINLQKLILTRIGCSINGARSIGYLLRERTCSLEVLDVSDNELQDSGISHLLLGVSLNNSLLMLRLWNTSIGSLGAHAIGDMISHNVQLRYLDLSHNPIGPWGVVSLERALQCSSNHSLGYLFYSFSYLRAKQHNSIQTRLLYNRSLYRKNQAKLSIAPACTIQNARCKQQQAFCLALPPKTFTTQNLLGNGLAVTRLVLSSIGLTSIPSSFTYIALPSIRELVLCNNSISHYEIEIALAERLYLLDLSFNELNEIPVCLSTHKNLVSLHIARNQLTNVHGLCDLISLRRLRLINISGNWINSIPIDKLQSFTRLDEFIIHNNLMPTVKEIIYRAFFLHHTALDLSNHGLKSLPNDFVYLNKHLLLLNLSRNRFRIAPHQLRHLNQLQQILMKHNCFKQIEDLYLGSCIGNPRILVSPGEFQSSAPQIKEKRLLSISVENRPVLAGVRSALSTKNSKGSNSPPMLREKSIGFDISGALSMVASKSIQQFNLVKVIHVGQMNRVANHLFHHLDEFASVHDVSVRKCVEESKVYSQDFHFCACNSTHRESEHVTLELYELPVTRLAMWNFCGPDTTQLKFFKHDSAIYVLYFDTCVPLEHQIIQYLQIIHSTCSSPFIILAGLKRTKIDEISPNQLSQQLESLQRLGFQSIKFLLILEVSILSMAQVFQYIANIIREEDDLPILVNTQDKDLIELISTETEYTIPPIITYSNLSIMARSCCMQNYDKPKPIVRYLNNIGRVLYIDDQNLGLADVIVLDRNWIVNACVELFSARLSNGILSIKDISNVWKPPCFPGYLLDAIIALLIKHEIIVRISLLDHKNDLLVPSMMSEYKPLLYDLWIPLQEYIPRNKLDLHPQPEISRILSFPMVAPHDYLERLIVRLFYLTKPQRYWKRGILVQKQENLCLIEQLDDFEILFRFRARHPFKMEETLVPFIRVIMETAKQLAAVFRVDHTFNVSFLRPSVGINAYFQRPEMAVYEDLVKGKLAAPPGEPGEEILYCDIAPDIMLRDMENFQINMKEVFIGNLIGQGSFGSVYDGCYRDVKVAIKEMNISDSDSMEAFSREVWMSATLKHPALAELIGFSWSPLSMVLEFIAFGDLHEFLQEKKTPLRWDLRLKMALDIASAMEYLHTRDPVIIHRDLKTPNCLISGFSCDEVVVKVTDFGESVLLVETYKGRDNLQNPVWMAPEILRNEAYDHLSDVHSFAIIMWELFTREFPFGEFPVADSPFKALLEDAIVDGLRPSIPNSCPAAYAEIIRNCWQNDAKQRPSFSLLVSQLEEMRTQCSSWKETEI